MKSIFYIDEGNCADCYQCVRVCPTHAISINNFKASIIESRCVKCAKCIYVCPQNLIGYVSHIEKCRNIIRTNETIVASLSPAWVGEFKGVSINKIVEALKLLGFTYVSETTLGAEVVVSESYRKIIEEPSNLKITTICPVINNLILKKYPKLVGSMIELNTPSVIHARQLKQKYGNDVKIVTIGSCVAAKDEVDGYDDLVSASITFNELKEWLKDEDVFLDVMIGHSSYDFEPCKAKECTEYAVVGGVFNQSHINEKGITDSLVCSLSGIGSVIEALDNLNEEVITRQIVVELYACCGGCLFGEAATQRSGQFSKVNRLIDYSVQNKINPTPRMPVVPFTKHFKAEHLMDNIGESSIIEMIQNLSIDTSKELINCGGCGYSECKEFAKQVILGYAHKEMCVWLKKSVAENTFSSLLENMPSGVAVIDSSMNIIEANRNFAMSIGPEAVLAFETYHLLKGFDARRIVPFIKYVEDIFVGDEIFIEKDIQIKEKLVKVSIVKLTNIGRVVVIIRNLFQNDVQSDEIVNRTRSVINDNLQTVQQIAYLLGETASRTEAVLNSIIESQKGSNERK